MRYITGIQISGLNGHTNVYFPIKNRHCIVVGPNGSGKSTALQIVAYALGRQWKRLSAMRFDEITIEFSGESFSLSKSSCMSMSKGSGPTVGLGRTIEKLREADVLEAFVSADLSDRDTVQSFARYVGAPVAELRAAQRFARTRHEDKAAQAELMAFQTGLTDKMVPTTVYLPTYRRIELEMSRFIGELPEFIKGEIDAVVTRNQSTKYYEEIVRFGMEDIVSLLQGFEKRTREFSTNRFNKMMSFFLKEMANEQSISITTLRSFELNEIRIEEVLSRIEEGILSHEEKEQITSIILSMSAPQRQGGIPAFHKRWLSHFFVRLLEVDRDIQELERPIRGLVDDLKKYIAPKKASYDIENYHFSIKDVDGGELSLSDLSSGEKQLVSLLSYLQLSAHEAVNVFIDEPELSLSVPWQSDFLSDVSATRACRQIFAVTHSPFIYENAMSDSVVDFLECSERA